ncbi:hypothetical protein C4K25_3256 [Pseudomonas chlororaphis]|nr:hypothetical protein C4K25_3256 [Pseudomonas chlororaphis]
MESISTLRLETILPLQASSTKKSDAFRHRIFIACPQRSSQQA